MRVRCPFPLALNHSTTSLSRRRWTEVFPAGMTTRAFFQKSASRDSASGASRLVLSSPRSRMVDFSFISARFLGADDADKVFSPPGEDDSIHFRVGPAERDEANLSIVFPVVNPLQNLVAKISAAVRNETWCLLKLVLAFSSSHSNSSSTHRPVLNIIHKCVHDGNAFLSLRVGAVLSCMSISVEKPASDSERGRTLCDGRRG
jgi:hypothetical protein